MEDHGRNKDEDKSDRREIQRTYQRKHLERKDTLNKSGRRTQSLGQRT